MGRSGIEWLMAMVEVVYVDSREKFGIHKMLVQRKHSLRGSTMLQCAWQISNC